MSTWEAQAIEKGEEHETANTVQRGRMTDGQTDRPAKYANRSD